jgi:hypothetical protein
MHHASEDPRLFSLAYQNAHDPMEQHRRKSIVNRDDKWTIDAQLRYVPRPKYAFDLLGKLSGGQLGGASCPLLLLVITWRDTFQAPTTVRWRTEM